MRGIDLDRSPQLGVHPSIADAAARENESMDRPVGVNDGEPNVAVCRDVRKGTELMPHDCAIESMWRGCLL